MKLAPDQCAYCLNWIDYFKDWKVVFNGKNYHKHCLDILKKAIEKRKAP